MRGDHPKRNSDLRNRQGCSSWRFRRLHLGIKQAASGGNMASRWSPPGCRLENEKSQMIKFTILLRKRQDLSHEEFVQYHKNNHAPLFKSLPEVQQYVRKYVQGHTQPVTLPGLPPPAYDGTTELWFDDVDLMTLRRSRNSLPHRATWRSSALMRRSSSISRAAAFWSAPRIR